MGRYEDFHVGASPVSHIVEASLQYQRNNGLLGGPEDYSHAVMPAPAREQLANAYDRLPSFDPQAVPAYRQMAQESGRQFEFMTGARSKGGLGLDVEVSHQDPYGQRHPLDILKELRQDIMERNKIKVLGTQATGGHPIFSDDENDMFRAVHDVFGHLGAGRGVDAHGEEAAFQKHSRMFSPLAQQALATETRGQNASLHAHGGQFQEQKVALLPAHMQSPQFTQTAGDIMSRLSAVREARMKNESQGVL